LLNGGSEKLALVATFAIIALGAIAGILGVSINWFFPLELILGGTSAPVAARTVPPKVKNDAPKADAPVKPEPTNSPSKKGGKH